MAEQEEENYFEALGKLSGTECPHCGEMTSSFVDACEVCGESLGLESDDPSLDLVEGTDRKQAALERIAVHESKNLKKLTEARDGVLDGSLVMDGYLDVVEEVLAFAESAIEFYESPWAGKELSEMPEDAAQIYDQLAMAAHEMKAALLQMLKYQDSLKGSDIDEGLAMFEKALVRVSKAQDVAIRKAEGVVQDYLARQENQGSVDVVD